MPSGGASVLAWVSFAGSAALTLVVSTTLYAVTYDVTTKVVSDMLGDTYYLPMYEVTPYEIFADKVLLFDVNFFNPKEEKIKDSYDDGIISLNYSVVKATYYNNLGESESTSAYKLNDDQYNEFKDTYGFKDDESIVTETGNTYNFESSYSHREGSIIGSVFALRELEWTHEGRTFRVYYEYKEPWPGVHEYYIKDLRLVSGEPINEKPKEVSTAQTLQPTVSAWYVTLRNIALVSLLSVLVYIGIRITLSSVASEKAKYKQMLVDWIVAICLVFLMHYIMSFSVSVVGKITDMLTSINQEDDTTQELKATLEAKNPDAAKVYRNAVELFLITSEKSDGGEDTAKVQNAYKILIEDHNDDNNQYKSYFFTDTNLTDNAESKSEAKVLLWPANNAMEQARMRLQLLGKDGTERPIMFGYAIIYIVLILYTLIFSFTYMKRVIYMTFLTIIAPLVAVTYPIDKLNDGKAQAFDMWIKEYIFNLLIQPLHLLLYIILIGSAMTFAAKNIFYVVLALGFFVPAEKLLRRFFGFEKAQTPGAFGGAAGAALLMSGLNKLKHQPSKGGNGSGDNSKDSEEDNKPPKNKELDATQNLIGAGDDEEDENVPDIRTEDTNAGEDFGGQTNWTTSNDTYAYNTDNNGEDTSNDTFAFKYARRDSQEGTTSNSKNTPNPQPTNYNIQPKRKRSIRRAIGRGARNYKTGLQKRYQAKKAAKGGIIKRGIRMAGGLAAAGTMAAAGGIIGIASGDPSKAAQYIGAGAGVGYALGKTGVNKVTDTVGVKNTIKEAKKGYYGDEYKDIQKEKFRKQFIKDEENLKKIEDKMHVEREEAEKIAERIAEYTQEKGIDDVESALAVDQLVQKEKYSIKEALTVASYNNRILEGKDTRHMRRDDLKEHKQSFKERLVENGKNEADADKYTNNLFRAMDKFNEYKN